MSTLKRVVKKVIPPTTPAGRVLQKAAVGAGLAKPYFVNNEYQNWITYIEPEVFLPVVSHKSDDTPMFSIVIPFYNTPEKYLRPLLASIVNQSFTDWELIIADASTDAVRAAAIHKASHQDSRLKYHRIERNEGISGNTNQALGVAVGKYIIFTDHDDVLSPHALNEAAAKVLADPTIDILYSDEDKLSDNGKWRHSPYFKGDWSPHLFLYTNYTNHLSVIKHSHVKAVGGLRPAYDGSQDYDLLLRIHAYSDKPLNVVHIPKILYHWREAAGSTAADYSSKSYAFEAGRKALTDFVAARGVNGVVESIAETPGFFRLVLQPTTLKKVQVLVDVSPNRVENESLLHKLQARTQSTLEVTFENKTPTTVLNHGKDAAIIEFNRYALPESTDWLDRLVGVLELPDVAAVAPRLLSSDRHHVVDLGIVYGPAGETLPLMCKHGYKDMSIAGGALWVRDVDELTGAVVAYRGEQGAKRRAGQHYVVWSHVEFVTYRIFGGPTYFNNNLQVLSDGRITVND